MTLSRSPVPIRTRDMTAAWRHLDPVLIGCLALLSAIGAALVHSSTRFRPEGTFLFRHLAFVFVGVGVCALCAGIDYRRWVKHAVWLYAGALGLLALVLVPGVGRSIKGTKGWFDFGVIQFQPAEAGKLGVILALAAFLGRERESVRGGMFDLVGSLTIAGIPMGLVLLQPDLGSVLVYVLIGAGVMLVGGVRGRYLVLLGVVAVGGTVGILNSDALAEYQRDRLTTFVQERCPADNDACYNVRQAQIAISSGGMTGYGYGRGPQTRGRFVPEQQTDFIFTVAGEEFGFLGSAVILGLFALLAWRVWYSAMVAADRAGQLICTGVLCMLMFHMFENIGMSMGMMPVTGIPLPFLSYGGSSMMAMFAAVGLVLNVHMRQWTG